MKKNKKKAKQTLKKLKKVLPWSKYEFVEEKTDKFWDKKAFKQCLWQYYIKIKKGKLTTEKDKDKVWAEFNSIGRDAEKRFAEKKEKAKQLKNPPITKVDYIKKLYDGLEKRGLKTFIQKNNYTLKHAKINLTNITQGDAQLAISFILRAEAERK